MVSVNKIQTCIPFLKSKAALSDLQYKHSAGIMIGNKLISFGINKIAKNLKSKTIHAEVDALISIKNKNIRNLIGKFGIDIVVIRVDKKLKLQNSRPCNCCIEYLKTTGIRRVFYTNNFGELVYEFLNDMPKLHYSSGYNYMKRHNDVNIFL